MSIERRLSLGDLLSIFPDELQIVVTTEKEFSTDNFELIYVGSKKSYSELPEAFKKLYDHLIVTEAETSKKDDGMDLGITVDINSFNSVDTQSEEPAPADPPQEEEEKFTPKLYVPKMPTPFGPFSEDEQKEVLQSVAKQISYVVEKGILKLCIDVFRYKECLKNGIHTDGFIDGIYMVVSDVMFERVVVSEVPHTRVRVMRALMNILAFVSPASYTSFPTEILENSGTSFYTINMNKLNIGAAERLQVNASATGVSTEDTSTVPAPANVPKPVATVDPSQYVRTQRPAQLNATILAINDGVTKVILNLIADHNLNIAPSPLDFKEYAKKGRIDGFMFDDNILAITEDFFLQHIARELCMDRDTIFNALDMTGNRIKYTDLPQDLTSDIAEDLQFVLLNLKDLRIDLDKIPVLEKAIQVGTPKEDTPNNGENGSNLGTMPKATGNVLKPATYENGGDGWFFQEFIRWVLANNIVDLRTGMVQSKFNITHARASRLIGLFESAGLVVPSDVYHHRAVLIDKCREWMLSTTCPKDCSHCVYYSYNCAEPWCRKMKTLTYPDGDPCRNYIRSLIDQEAVHRARMS